MGEVRPRKIASSNGSIEGVDMIVARRGRSNKEILVDSFE
jgi:hypothetical protein